MLSALPVQVICSHLDLATTLAARKVAVSMREACSVVPVDLRFTLPMQSSPWVPAQLEAWDRRINGVAGLLGNSKMLANELQLRMEGAEAWKVRLPVFAEIATAFPLCLIPGTTSRRYMPRVTGGRQHAHSSDR